MKVQEVKYIAEHTISIKFDDGISGTIQLKDLVQKGIFKVLQDKNQFAKVYTNGYSIAWSDELEIDATKIYCDLTGKNFGEILSPKIDSSHKLVMKFFCKRRIFVDLLFVSQNPWY